MIVLEGTSCAGKTTRIGQLLTAWPDDVLVLPEAQAAAGTVEERNGIRDRLVEDRSRVEIAAQLAATWPELLLVSDRCHIGVLAVHHARATTGWGPPENFEYALALVEELDLVAAHRDDTVLILLLDPAESLRRRPPHAWAVADRFPEWYRLDFLRAYNDFLRDLDKWMRPGPGWRVLDADDPAVDEALQAHLPPAASECAVSVEGEPLRCRDCLAPYSRPVLSRGALTQLWPNGVHRRQPATGEVACLRTVADIAAPELHSSRAR